MEASVRGHTIHYRDQGAGAPIVWIHGFPLTSAIFDHQLTIGDARHILPDLPGFGASPTASDISIDGFADDLLALADQLDLEGLCLAGLSMGGYVALSAVRKAADRIRGLILIDTRAAADTPEAKKKREETAEKIEREGLDPVIEEMLPRLLSDRS
ncbi:MAG TPA: alpha/beta hydrolase, partial [Thermoanaerobaculia bacterium]|nr:alpha/beta hydrolase [Thermoanaerobaculia bacterium]